MSTLILTKFDVAERQLLQAIIMFFRDEDPVSIHTLSEASGQILSDIGKSYGAKSIVRDSDLIRDGKKKEWLGHIFASRNFFKHADRDKDKHHKFKEEFNHFSILDGVNMYSSIKKRWVPETMVFQSWFGVMYPHLLKENSDIDTMLKIAKKNGHLFDPNDRIFLYKLIKTMRSGKHVAGNISLKYGL